LEATQQIRFMGVGDVHSLRKNLPPFRRKVEGVGTAVSGIAAPLDQLMLFEVVDQPDHSALWNVEQLGQRLLRPAFGRSHRVKQPDMARLDAQRSQTLFEPACRVEAQLDEQESGALGM
jgi:hypothetical protein